MITLSKKNLPVPITVLSDWWLLLCVPLLVLNIFMYLTRRTVLAAYFAALRLLSTPVLRLLSAFRLVNIPCLVLVNTMLTVLLLVLSLPTVHPVSLFLILSIAVTAMMCIQTSKKAIEYSEGNRSDLILAFTTFQNRPGISDKISIPQGLQIEKLSLSTWLGSIMVSLFGVCQFTLLLIADTGSIVFLLCLHSLLLVSLLIDFEMVEHLSSHSRNGVLVKIKQGSFAAWLLYVLEQIRIYVVWPMYYWAPRRYFLTHTHHHHVENNGPADWQSTLRFDLTSVADFCKSLLWLQLSFLMPVDTARYLWALGRKRHFNKLMISSALNLLVILFVFYIEPLFGAMLFFLYLSMAWAFHSFVFAWHGFHDATKPYDVIASNNSTGHYAHHKDPGMHLFSPELREIFSIDSINSCEAYPVHQSNVAYNVISKHWLLIQCLLWQKKYSVIRNLIKSEHLDNRQLHRLVTGLQLYNRHPIVESADTKVSKLIGAVLEKCLKMMVFGNQRSLLYSTTH